MKQPGLSYWERELYDRRYDLIVIGAGLTGQSISLFYKKAHPEAEVLVVDRGFYPLGASTRNAGFACFGSVTEHMADLEIEKESKIVDRIRRRYEGLKLLRSTLGDENIRYEEPGGYEIFTDKEIYEEAVSKLDYFNGWLEKATGVSNVYSAMEYNGYPSIKIEMEGMLHPGKMMNTLHQKNLELGVEFRWESKVTNLDMDQGELNLKNGKKLNTKQVAISTNSFTGDFIDNIEISPGRGFVFITKPLPELRWKGSFHYNKGYYYFRNVGDHRLLLGGARNLDTENESTTEFGTNPKIKEHLTDFAATTLKLGEDWEIDQEWSGIMGFSKTKSPVLERVSNRCVAAVGLSGMGVALGMQLGKEAAGLLEEA